MIKIIIYSDDTEECLRTIGHHLRELPKDNSITEYTGHKIGKIQIDNTILESGTIVLKVTNMGKQE